MTRSGPPTPPSRHEGSGRLVLTGQRDAPATLSVTRVRALHQVRQRGQAGQLELLAEPEPGHLVAGPSAWSTFTAVDLHRRDLGPIRVRVLDQVGDDPTRAAL